MEGQISPEVAIGVLVEVGRPQELVGFELESSRFTARFDAHAAARYFQDQLRREGLVGQLEPVPPARPTTRLSARELELIQNLSRGLSFKESARVMRVSGHTAREYWRRAQQKWNVHSIPEAAAMYGSARTSGAIDDGLPPPVVDGQQLASQDPGP